MTEIRRVWNSTSPSQLKNFVSCQRRWFCDSVLGLKPPADENQFLGTVAHRVLEVWQLEGRTLGVDGLRAEFKDEPLFTDTIARKAIAIAKPGYAKLPEPMSIGKHFVEREFAIPSYIGQTKDDPKDPDGQPTGILIRGKIDLIHLPIVTDYKTTKDFAYMLTEEQLRRDFQSIIYLREVLRYSPLQRATFRHLYLNTRAPEAREAKVEVGRDENLDLFESLKETHIRSQAELARADEKDVPQNKTACNAYNKVCPHYGRCFGETKMGLLDRLKNNQAAKPPTPAATTPSAPPKIMLGKSATPPVAPPASAPNAPSPAVSAPAAPSAEAERLKLIEALVEKGFDRSTLGSKSKIELFLLSKQAADPVNPPDGTPHGVVGEVTQGKPPKVEIPPSTATRPNDRDSSDESAATGGSVSVKGSKEWIAGASKAELRDFIVEQGKPEPAKAVPIADLREIAHSLAQEAAIASVPQMPEPMPAEAPEKRSALAIAKRPKPEVESKPESTGLRLYVGCTSTARTIPRLEDVIADVIEEVEREPYEGVLYAYYGAIPYGNGGRLVAQVLARELAKGSIELPAEIHIDPSSILSSPCLEVLRRYAVDVIQVVRS